MNECAGSIGFILASVTACLMCIIFSHLFSPLAPPTSLATAILQLQNVEVLFSYAVCLGG